MFNGGRLVRSGLLGASVGVAECLLLSDLWRHRFLDSLLLLAAAAGLYLLLGLFAGLLVPPVERLLAHPPWLARWVPRPQVFLLLAGFGVLYGLVAVNQRWMPDRPFLDPLSLVADLAVFLAVLAAALGGSLLAARLPPRLGAGLPVTILAALLLLSLRSLPVPGPGPRTAVGRADQPSIVLVTLDTTRRDFLSLYGFPFATTPEIDRFAAAAHVFEQAVCHIPNTGPGHASLFTSIHPNLLGMEKSNGIPLPSEFRTLAEILRRHGYTTAAVVSGFPLTSLASGLDQGFDSYEQTFSVTARLMPLALVAVAVKLSDRLGFQPLSLAALERKADRTTELALDWLKRGHRRPFFLWVHYFDPHGPYQPPPGYGDDLGDNEPQASYAGEIRFTDHQLGRLLRRLETPEFAATTIVAITADHGESLGEHGYIGHSFRLHETDLAVPLLLRRPDSNRTVRHPEPVSLLDLAPTLLELAGVPVPEAMMGRSLLPLLDGVQDPASWQLRPLFMETASVRPLCLSGLRRGRYKLIHNGAADTTDRFYHELYPVPALELYDLLADPREQVNLASTAPELRDQLLAGMEVWIRATEDIRQQPTAAPSAHTLEKLRALGYLQ
jgi:arylsulfatase A-like enzyme